MKGIIIAIVAGVIGALVAFLIVNSRNSEFLYLWGLAVGSITSEIINYNKRSKD